MPLGSVAPEVLTLYSHPRACQQLSPERMLISRSSGKGPSVPPPRASPELLPRMEIPQTVVPCRPTAPIPTHDNNTRTYCTARVRYLQIIAPSRLGESHRPITVSPGYRDPSGAQIRGCAPAPAPWRHVRWARLRPLAKPFSL